MRVLINTSVFLILNGLLLACSSTDTGTPAPLVEVSPELSNYPLTDTTFVNLNIFNRADASVFYGGCDKQWITIESQETVQDQFTTQYDCECICIVEIEPGETETFTYNIQALKARGPSIDSDRYYRIWPYLYKNAAFQDTLYPDLVQVTPFFLYTPSQ